MESLGKTIISFNHYLQFDPCRITQVTGQEAGRYKCNAQNEAGSVDAIVTLTIHQPPTIRLEPQRSVTIGVGKPLSIRCTVTGDPPPAITWKKLGGT